MPSEPAASDTDIAQPANPAVKTIVTIRNNAPLGIGLMLTACLLFVTKDMATKLLTTTIPVKQLLFLQPAVMVVALIVVSPLLGPQQIFRIVSWKWHLVRAGIFVVNMFLFISALSHLPFATATVLALLNPLFMTAMAPLFLKERVGWQRWAAVLTGFGGVVIITRAWSGEFPLAALFPLGSAFCGALRDLVTRHMVARDTTGSMLLYSMVAVTIAGGIMTGGDFVPMDGREIWLLVGSALAQLAAFYCLIEAMRNAFAVVIAPFKFSLLLWIILMNFLVWGELPPINVIVGGTVIFGTMLYIYLRERRRNGSSVSSNIPLSG